MTSDIISIILSCDDRFVRHAAVVIISIIKNSARRYRFYLLDCGISEANVQKLQAWDLGDNEIVVVKMEKNAVFESIPLQPWFSPAIFYRIMIPELFPELDKAIYLDCDIVVVGDLGELWDVDLGDKLLGVVYEEKNFYASSYFFRRKKLIGMRLEQVYFNSGVLLFNCRQCRHMDFSRRCADFLQKNQNSKFPDQDALNVCCMRQNQCELPWIFNFLAFAQYSFKKIKKNMPICIHYSGIKPWQIPKWCMRLFPLTLYQLFSIYMFYVQWIPFGREYTKQVSYYTFIRLTWKILFQPFERYIKAVVRFFNFRANTAKTTRHP